jgi:hypothetical protein
MVNPLISIQYRNLGDYASVPLALAAALAGSTMLVL